MQIFIVILFIVIGIVLLLFELFLLPGFGIAGVSGFMSLAAAVVYAYLKLTAIYPWAGHITLISILLLIGIAIYVFMKSRALDKMGLDATIDSHVDMPSAGKRMEKMANAASEEKTETNK